MDTVTSAICWIVVSLATHIRIRRYAGKFPVREAPWPLVGHFRVALYMDEPGIVKFLTNLVSKNQSGVIWFGVIPVFYVWNPKDVERVLCNPKAQRKPPLYWMLEPSFEKGLVTSSGKLWQHHHKIIAPSFHTKILDSFVPTLNEHVDVFINILHEKSNGVSFDILPMIQECICERVVRPWLHNPWVYSMSSTCRREKAAIHFMHGTRDRVIKDRMEKILADDVIAHAEDGKRRRLAFLDHLLISVKASANLTDKEIAEEVDTHMAAGSDTTSLLISLALLEMARHQDIQDNVLEELKKVYDVSLHTISVKPEDLSRLTYLEMVLKETLRFHPPAPVILRQVEEDLCLATNDLVIPAGAQVGVPIFSAHRNPDIYPDPEHFDPERFSLEMSKKRNPFAFFPFGAGQRICIGRRLAMMEAEVAVAKVVWQYKFLHDPEYEPVRTWGITMKPVNGVRLKIKKRR